jgi:rare lipoprotein A
MMKRGIAVAMFVGMTVSLAATAADAATRHRHHRHHNDHHHSGHHHSSHHHSRHHDVSHHHRHYSRAALSAHASLGSLMSGIASVYFSHGQTASGVRMQRSAMIAAHRTLPFGTRVKVTNKHNGRSVVVRIIDRGPFIRGRVIDLSPGAAHALGFSGLAPVALAVEGH